MSWTWFSLSVKENSGNRLNAPPGLTWDEAWSWLEDQLGTPGAEIRLVDLGIGYHKQCNLGFSPEEIKTISDARATFAISCYEEDKEREENETRSK